MDALALQMAVSAQQGMSSLSQRLPVKHAQKMPLHSRMDGGLFRLNYPQIPDKTEDAPAQPQGVGLQRLTHPQRII